MYLFSFVVQLLSRVQLFATPWTAARQDSLSFTISQSFFKLMSVESMILSNHLILCYRPFHLPSVFSSIRVFSNESALPIRWPKYWSFSINPSDKSSVFIFFRIEGFDLLAVQGTLKESSPAPQSEDISFSVLSLLYGPTRTSLHDYWKLLIYTWFSILTLALAASPSSLPGCERQGWSHDMPSLSAWWD